MSAGGGAAADVSAAAFELLETAGRLCLKSGVSVEAAVNGLEETMFRQALCASGGDVGKAARALGCDVEYMRFASRMRGYRLFDGARGARPRTLPRGVVDLGGFKSGRGK